jgi:hypothetical protein
MFERGWTAVSAESIASITRQALWVGQRSLKVTADTYLTTASTTRRCVEAHLACGQRVEKRGEGIVLDKRPDAGVEIYATSVVPVHGHANSIGAPAMSSGEPATKSVRAALTSNASSASRYGSGRGLYAPATSAVATT